MTTNENKPYWHDSLIVFGRISAWIIGPIIIALFLGKWLDGRFGTTPVLFAVTMGVSFLLSSYGIVREAKKYLKTIQSKNSIEKKESNEPNSTGTN